MKKPDLLLDKLGNGDENDKLWEGVRAMGHRQSMDQRVSVLPNQVPNSEGILYKGVWDY